MTGSLGLFEHEGWRLKLYGISARGDRPSPDAEAAARELIGRVCPSPAVTEKRHGVGFAVIHEGEDALWVLVDWWEDACMLHHQVFSAPLDAPDALRPVPGTITACTWELFVVCHERDAWVDAVQKRGPDGDLDEYLSRVLEVPPPGQ